MELTWSGKIREQTIAIIILKAGNQMNSNKLKDQEN